MISSRSVYFVVVLAVFLAVLVTIGAYYCIRYRRFRYGTWESLLKGLSSVDRDRVASIALDLVDESGQRKIDEDPSDLEPSQIWASIGGLKGLEVLERNCAVLVNLAFYVQQWYPEALLVAEQLRLNAREIEWHVDRLRTAAQIGNLEASFPDYAPRAIATYYVMTRRLLALYEQCDLPGLADLQRIL
jgi:hypothetical protein